MKKILPIVLILLGIAEIIIALAGVKAPAVIAAVLGGVFRAYPEISRTLLAPRIFHHTALIFLAGRQPACEKSPCLAKNLRLDQRTANFRIGSYSVVP